MARALFTNLTRGNVIGANCYLLEIGGRTILIDSGMHPREEGPLALPDFSMLDRMELDAVLVSHSHLDHVGSLPLVARRHPKARFLLTEATARLTEAMMHNSVNVMVRKRDELNLPDYPLFTHREADDLAERWRICRLNTTLTLDGERATREDREAGEVTVTFFDAGHVLGSVGILIEAGGQRVFYTGDVNFENQTLCRAAEFPEEPVDALIVETTRGSAPRPPGYTRENEIERLAQTLNKVHQRGGAILIPVFALGRTQELLAILHSLMTSGRVPVLPVCIGGLSTKMSRIYDKLTSAPRHSPGLNLLKGIGPQVLEGRQIPSLTPAKGHIYALSSGMMTENTPSNVFARKMLADPRHAILFVGYSDPVSPAGRIRAAQPGDLIALNPRQDPLPLRCEVAEFDLSAHACRDDILNYIRAVRPAQAFLVHGDEPALQWFASELTTCPEKIPFTIPKPGQTIEI